MEEELASRLLTSIETDRLVTFCGAGLSMAPPSLVPSAQELARSCSAKYEDITGSTIPPELRENTESLAEFFWARGDLKSLFIRQLVPWALFKRNPNPGHFAIADFLACGVFEFGLTTNVDSLVEIAANALGQSNFQPSLDGNEATLTHHDHNPFLKLHGCCVRDQGNTLWCSSQLNVAPLRDRIASSKGWLQGYLLNRDLLVIGFWSDWAYLNHVLEDCVNTIEPNLVVLVDPDEATNLVIKAPNLWNWASNGNVNFIHVRESGTDFLDELRRRFSRRYLERLAEASKPTYMGMTGTPFADPVRFTGAATAEELYALRIDFSGKKGSNVPRTKRPDPSMHQLGAYHLLLMANRAVLEGSIYVINGKRIRLVHGAGELLSSVKSRFSEEPPPPVELDLVICVGAIDDGGAPVNVVREQGQANIIRGGISGEWSTLEQARQHLGI